MCKEIVTGQDAGAAENVLLQQLSVLASAADEAEKSVLDPVSVDSPTASEASEASTLETSPFEATTVFQEVPEGSC